MEINDNLLTECICALQRRFNSTDVWYSTSNGIVSVGYGDLIYYKLGGDQVIWKALYQDSVMCNGMNLEKERELFEQWFVPKYPYTSLDRDKGVVGTYWHERVEMSWQSWLSSIDREGYRLVSVIDKNICDHIWHGKSENQYCGKCGEYD